jgi:ABC-2 type transport system permease protein
MITFLQSWQETWRRIATDPGARLLLLVAPVLYSLFYPLPYLREVVRDVPVAVVDFDRSSLSRQLVRYAEAHENLRIAARFDSVAAAEAALKDGQLRGYLIVPAHFRQDVLRGREATVAYGGDATYFLQFKQALAGFAETVGTLNAGIKARQLLAAGRNREQALAAVAPATLRPHPLGNTREGYAGYLIPGVFLIILQQTLILGVGLLRGTACEQGVGPLSLSGRGFAGVVAALVTLYGAHAAFHLGWVTVIYDLPSHGQPGWLALFLAPFLLASVLLALAASGCCTRREESIHLFLVTSVPVLFLAGSSWPFEMMPAPLQWLARLVPSTAGIQGVLRLNSLQARWEEVSDWWFLLWGLAALFAWPAWRSWRTLARPSPDCPRGAADPAQ